MKTSNNTFPYSKNVIKDKIRTAAIIIVSSGGKLLKEQHEFITNILGNTINQFRDDENLSL
jgi:hypothetical protein